MKIKGHKHYIKVTVRLNSILIKLVKEGGLATLVIINPLQVTRIPHSHPSIKWMIQLRGELLPVVDL
ncbi:chemotaxis protein CheW [Sporosarcina sp. G11-34]|uniref:chemotaxis protein CheW n=1 Tax=Sporosarcina sp. G11-34 TaxID=2849605 RepID=UPI002E77D29F|nr:chemotaxis protein CheW [Sporosarcina sp. G11-34]MCZ2257180.1 chemotaxis protein CheW [Sporosarcina sp. G11-34]